MTKVLLLILIMSSVFAQKYSWESLNTGVKASFRGISAINNQVCWVSGSNGTIIKTKDGGKTWEKLSTPAESDSVDFRDIQAFSSRIAYIMGAGPGKQSKIFKTTDGGKTWEHQFTNTYKDGFFTAISFWDESHGIVLSDPVEGTHYILTTVDGGKNWIRINPENIPKTVKGEYGFAASGTNMTIREGGHVWIGSGGEKARIFYSNDYGNNWVVYEKTPIQQGAPSKGIFSLIFTSDKNGIAVGGDYTKSKVAENCVMLTQDGGKTWKLTENPNEMAYRSSIREFPKSKKLIAVGRSGSSTSQNNGKNWTFFSEDGYYTVDIGDTDDSCFAAGPKGKVARLKIN